MFLRPTSPRIHFSNVSTKLSIFLFVSTTVKYFCSKNNINGVESKALACTIKRSLKKKKEQIENERSY